MAMNNGAWRQRELVKKLPLDQDFPAGKDLAVTLERYGLTRRQGPQNLPMPSRIVTGVFLVGQDRFTNLTYMIDCGPEGVAVIDPSYDSEFDRTVANIEQCGRSKKDIRWVINTHCHADHSLADRKFEQLGAKIIIHEADASAIEQGTRATVFDRYNLPEFPRSNVARRLSDGEELKLGDKVFHVIHTPGHTPGSACFVVQMEGKNLLFSGDTVFFDGMLAWQGNPYADNRQYLASLVKLERFTLNARPVHWDVLLPGHASIALDRAYLDVQKAREALERDLVLGRDPFVPRLKPEYRKRMFGRPSVEYILQ